MTHKTTRIIRNDRKYKPNFQESEYDIYSDALDFFRVNRLRLEASMTDASQLNLLFTELSTFHQQKELQRKTAASQLKVALTNLRKFIQQQTLEERMNESASTDKQPKVGGGEGHVQLPMNVDEFQRLAHAYLETDEYFVYRDRVERIKKNACLPGQYIANMLREKNDLDRYLVYQDKVVSGWSITAHMYDRLLCDNVYKLSRSLFFTRPYTWERKEQAMRGFTVGPLVTGLMATGLLTQTLPGMLLVLGFSCIPSLVYVIKGLECLLKSAQLAWSCPDKAAEMVQIKVHLEHALSCMMIAILQPAAWALCFPLELMRFITRSISTAVNATRPSLDTVVAELNLTEGLVF